MKYRPVEDEHIREPQKIREQIKEAIREFRKERLHSHGVPDWVTILGLGCSELLDEISKLEKALEIDLYLLRENQVLTEKIRLAKMKGTAIPETLFGKPFEYWLDLENSKKEYIHIGDVIHDSNRKVHVSVMSEALAGEKDKGLYILKTEQG